MPSLRKPVAARTRLHPWLYLAVLAVAALHSVGRPAEAQEIPQRIDDRTFWSMVEQMSEPGGFFRSDNFVSNEMAFQTVIPRLQAAIPPGGVYVGVGPEQNFTYIAALRPAIAFVIDIRRQNMLQHLLYKAMIEIASDRAEFLSLLFSRARPAGVGAGSSVEALMTAFQSEIPDSARFERNHEALVDRLTEIHGFTLSAEDLSAMRYVHMAFLLAGPDLSYSFGRGPGGGGRYGRRGMPSFAELATATDGAGVARSYLASEVRFVQLKDLEQRNLIVPLVGDFAGDRAVRAVGDYVRAHQATVSVFYTSNVEQYLFQTPDSWGRFYASVATMPLDAGSVFVRAVFGGIGGAPPYGMRSESLLLSIPEFLEEFSNGRVQSYFDVIRLSREFTVRGWT
ncbi:MAG: hypothetical protein MNPFHGCM_02658 [Gemmatimonadaceae bacterium]|nr:hypothetical protein [Gemmatimonadaceae bacterium]